MQTETSFFLQIWTRQLLKEHRSICYQYGVKLKEPIIELVDVTGYLGKWLAKTGTISLSMSLLLDHSWDVVLNVLKHEMAHQLVSEEMAGKPGHGVDFKKACTRLGIPAAYRKAAASDVCGEKRQLLQDVAAGAATRKLEKVRKLLALSDSANEHEAMLAMRKARQIMERYDLADEIEGKKSATQFTNLLINLKRKRLESYHRAICSLLIDQFNVKIVITPLFDARELTSFKCLDIMGRADHVEIAGYVYHFLMDRLPLMWQQKQRDGHALKNGRNSYWLGILNGFREGLNTGRIPTKLETTRRVPDNNLPAVAEEAALQSFLASRYPKVKNRRTKSAGVDPNSYEAGRREGLRLKLRKGLKKANETRMLPRPDDSSLK